MEIVEPYKNILPDICIRISLQSAKISSYAFGVRHAFREVKYNNNACVVSEQPSESRLLFKGLKGFYLRSYALLLQEEGRESYHLE